MNDTNNSSTTRRNALTTIAGGLLFGLAGCSGGSDSGSESSTEESGGNSGGTNNSSTNTSEQSSNEKPEDVENRAEGENRLTFQALEIVEHNEEVVEEEYIDDQLVISGVVENTDDQKYDSVTIGVRAYNSDGHQIDQYLDTTSNLQAGGTWAFEVSIYDQPAEAVSEWDIGVWGYQY